jgi:phosphoglycolate phosphatase-like HAD superfamily hydrolase
LITDFDGPIMDLSERYYQVYQFCLSQVQVAAIKPGAQLILSKSEFWRLKRDQTPEVEIGLLSGLDELQAGAFAQCRAQYAHTHPYFDYDSLVPGAVTALEYLHHQGVDVVVMTLRRESELNFALQQYNLEHLFEPERRFCLGDDYLKTNDVADKSRLMQQAVQHLPACEQTWMVGDTEADVLAARSQAIPVIAVLSGIRNLSRIQAHDPDWIVPDLAAAVQLILQHSYALSLT